MSHAFSPALDQNIQIPAHDSWPHAWHRFDQESVWAVQTALDIGRPLLLRGEPGIGKSQLARAVAHVLKVPFLYQVVDERSERDDLVHHYDAVARLAEAQVCSLAAKSDEPWKARLAEKNFIRPGVLWWAYDWDSAKQRAEEFHKQLERKWSPPVPPPGWTADAADRPCGPVVLIDEIDKADPSVPNGLLECLGNEGFQTAQLGEAVTLKKDAAGKVVGKTPFVIITTNEERELPSAFLRRCLVLHMQFPKEKEKAVEFLLNRADGLRTELGIDAEVCREVAALIVDDRAEVRGRVALPGASEYLELLRALACHAGGNADAQRGRLAQIKNFVLRKHDPVT